MNPEDITACKRDMERRCKAANLTPEQTAQVIDYRLDPWHCNSDDAAFTVIDFLERLNSQHCNNPLCSEHGDPRDTSIDVVRLGLAVPS